VIRISPYVKMYCLLWFCVSVTSSALASLGAPLWKGMLVRTGVFVDSDSRCGATAVCDNVSDAVAFIVASEQGDTGGVISTAAARESKAQTGQVQHHQRVSFESGIAMSTVPRGSTSRMAGPSRRNQTAAVVSKSSRQQQKRSGRGVRSNGP